MSGNPRILDTRPSSRLGKKITVADAASFDFNADESAAGFRDFAFDEFKCAIGARKLYSTHLRHGSSQSSVLPQSWSVDQHDKKFLEESEQRVCRTYRLPPL